jgi:hypothetical protein
MVLKMKAHNKPKAIPIIIEQSERITKLNNIRLISLNEMLRLYEEITLLVAKSFFINLSTALNNRILTESFTTPSPNNIEFNVG